MTLDDILHGTKYNMERFTDENKKALLARRMTKNLRGKDALYVVYPVRKKGDQTDSGRNCAPTIY